MVLDRRFDFDLGTLVRFNLYLLVPAFLFARLITAPDLGPEALRIVAFTLVSIACMGALSGVARTVAHSSPIETRAVRLSTMFYNCGNFGLPVVTLAFPEEGPVTHIWALMTMNIATFTIGGVLAGSGNASERDDAPSTRQLMLRALRMPSLSAIALALACRWFKIPIEDFDLLWKPISFTADALIAMALLTLGVQLSKTRPSRPQKAVAISLLIRLAFGPLVAAIACWAFGFGPVTSAVLILGASAPTAINTAFLAHEYGADREIVTASVFYSTLMSVVTVPLVLFAIKSLLLT